MSRRLVRQRMLAGLARTGVSRLVSRSGWRQRRLLIVCYHGVALDREHEWNPKLYMTPDDLRERFRLIRESGCHVLPLVEGIWRLRNETLPPRSVVLTFDDGGYDFYAGARPLLEEFEFPATVYLSTYYSVKQAPIFPLMASYLLWLGKGRRMSTSVVTGQPLELDLTTAKATDVAFWDILRFTRLELDRDDEKQAMLSRLADVLDIDYASLLARRILHVMSPEEIGTLGRANVDVQLHTHRHRSPSEEEAYRDEVRTNRELIRGMTGRLPRHFCYPSGRATPDFVSWLRKEGIHSATTCATALASPGDDRLLLPRLLDHSSLTPVEFASWLGGAGQLLARRHAVPTLAAGSPEGQILQIDGRAERGASLATAPR